VLENCIFYISPMYEFLHSQGHSRRFGFVRFRRHCGHEFLRQKSRWAISGHGNPFRTDGALG
jgi:hypothetical protein